MSGYERTADVMKALAHPERLRILEVLLTEEEACVCHLEARLAQRQAYISQQLAKLRQAGLVADRREGLNVFYAIANGGVGPLITQAKGLALNLAGSEGEDLDFTAIREIPPEECVCPKCGEKVAALKSG
jgi:DNA-binding transcriptional ArsR family regulator